MKVTFSDGRVFDLDLDTDSLSNIEAIAVERATGLDLGEFDKKRQKGSALALTALVWVMAKRQEPTLRFDEVDFDLGVFVAAMEAEDSPDPTSAGEPGSS